MLRLIHKGEHHPLSQITLKEYESRFRVIGSVSTVEEFWSLFKFIENDVPMHDLQCDLTLFRDGIEPKWEDLENTNGGAMFIFSPHNVIGCFRHIVCFFTALLCAH